MLVFDNIILMCREGNLMLRKMLLKWLKKY